MLRLCGLLGVCTAFAATARAQDAASVDQRDDDIEILQDEIEQLRRDIETVRPRANRFRGYVDIGFFATGGDGSGVRRDALHANFPEYDNVVPGAWVFMGDPLSTAVNSRGEPADTGPSRSIRLDAIDSQGAPSFLVNNLSLGLLTAVGPDKRWTVTGLMDFVPRERRATSDDPGSGRFVDVKLAFAEYWLPTEAPIAVYAGKVYSVLGIEYRTQESDQRLGVTPSLVCRYTCGYPTGVGIRGQHIDRALEWNAAITNGSHFVPAFSLSDDIDDNDLPTVAARAGWNFEIGTGVEVGASAMFGPQDEQQDNEVLQWHYGVDASADLGDFVLAAELVHGRAEGSRDAGAMEPRCSVAPCMKYNAAYGWLGWRATNWITPYARVDWRDALHQHGAEFVYVSELIRVTGGAHLEMGSYAIAKAEYTWNRELGRIPQFPNDVFATSLVIKY
jgi:hypothetical protein